MELLLGFVIALAISLTGVGAGSMTTPLLILPGNDQAHPYEIARELADLAPNAEFIADWREGEAKAAAFARVREFLRSHMPVSAA